MLQVAAAVLALLCVSVVLGVLVSQHRPRRAPHGSDGAGTAVSAHHWAVGALALSSAVALVLPPDLLGSPDVSDPWGGYVGRWVTIALVWVVLMLPVTAVARVVVARADAPPVRMAAATTAWVLLVVAGVALLAPSF